MALIYVIYHSETGNTHALADRVAKGAEADGAEVRVVSADDVNLAEVARADALAIGSPDYFNYVAGPVKSFFDHVLYDERFKGKPFVGFGTTGGSGKVVEVIASLARSCGLAEAAPGLLTRGRPSPAEVEKARELGRTLAQRVAHPPAGADRRPQPGHGAPA